MVGFLSVVIFLRMITHTLAKQCSYTSIEDVYYYTCLSSQYCCGRNSCCYSEYYYSVYNLWYFWFCLCFGIFICSLASGAYYRKRQLHDVQVAAAAHDGGGHGGELPVMHSQGAPNGGQGTSGPMYPAQQRNLIVTTTATSGQPVYPPIGYYHDDTHPGYRMFSAVGGPIYPAYYCLPPPPSYSSVADGGRSAAGQTPASTASRSTATVANDRAARSTSLPTGSDVPPVAS